MDLEVARKSLSKRSALSSKRVAFFVVAGLFLVVGILLRTGQYFGQPQAEETAPVTVAAPPPSAATPTAETTESAPETSPAAQEAEIAPSEPTEQTGTELPPDSGMILVSRKPVEVLASPSPSAPTMYGFPAGRPFRVIGREGGFAQILDLKSGASGWIDAAALAPPPRAPAISAPSQPTPAAVGQRPARPSADSKPKAAKKDGQVSAGSEAAAEPDSVQARRRPGLFGQGGLFGGIFSGN